MYKKAQFNNKFMHYGKVICGRFEKCKIFLQFQKLVAAHNMSNASSFYGFVCSTINKYRGRRFIMYQMQTKQPYNNNLQTQTS